ncbi:AMP-binding protein [Streptomyces iranensis]|uniref:AMP-dependent synthetase and ligase n=1 Tax=Streptomyces iranensis TaxID=576784 RepID=A0A060ZJQ3_9ACTN|nr:AMP-binding protein [Streptomyces iranensis]MBP2060869.1 amino acid adenylation domain-containing protein [Streptomyces iranensis]CDR06330.1 AMP-dependent synthetase and ligase [Streptomyces iranensis]
MADHQTLYERFAGSAALHGQAVAVELNDARVTYAELDRLAGTIAVELVRTLGRTPRTIGLYASRTLAAYAGYLAIQRLGAVAVPFNPLFPATRNATVAATARVDAVLSENDASPLPQPVLALTPAVLARLRDTPAPPEAIPTPTGPTDGQDTAYLLFTSGSTGVPKGVPVAHRNVSAYLDHVIPRYGLGPDSRVTQMFDLTFDLAVFDLFASWGSGATLVVPSRADLLAPVRFVVERRITHWFSVPSVVSLARRLGRLSAGSMPGLRWSLFCGEQLTLAQARAWRAAAPGAVLENLYGPTELTLSCAQYRLSADPGSWPSPSNGTVPIGELHPGHEELVIDPRGRVATEGELCIRGPQRFGGYLDPADNADRFVSFDGTRATVVNATEHPDDGLWYRTGDRVRRTEWGLVHLGRLDHQVKIQGYRIELGEIESALHDQPWVLDAVVVVVEASGRAAVLHAVYTGEAGSQDALSAALRRRLPAHMLPRTIAHWPDLPLNANGKVDRRAIAQSVARREETECST